MIFDDYKKMVRNFFATKKDILVNTKENNGYGLKKYKYFGKQWRVEVTEGSVMLYQGLDYVTTYTIQMFEYLYGCTHNFRYIRDTGDNKYKIYQCKCGRVRNEIIEGE